MNRLFGWSFIGLVLLSSCAKKTSPVSTVESKRLEIRTAEFSYLSSRARVKYKDESQSFSATANIRIKKDSIIWVSISPGLGIEAARGIITRDSVKFIDRVNREYHAYDFKVLSERYGVELDFQVFQSIFLGTMPKTYEGNEKVETLNAHYIVKQNEGGFSIDNFVNRENLTLEKVVLMEMASRNNLVLNYSEFQELKNVAFPYQSNVELQFKPEGASDFYRTFININHSKAEISDDELNFPFQVPARYEAK